MNGTRSDDFEALVRSELQREAAEVRSTDEAFDPARPAFHDTTGPTVPTGSTGNHRVATVRPWLMGAAAASVLAAVIVVGQGSRTEHIGTSSPPPSAVDTTDPTAGPAAAGLAPGPQLPLDRLEPGLLPRFTPPGIQLWGVDASTAEMRHEGLRDQVMTPATGGDGTILLTFQPATPGRTVEDMSGDPTTVRGLPARIMWAQVNDDVEIYWVDGAVMVAAVVKGVESNQAVAALQTLERASGGDATFATGTAGGWTVRSEPAIPAAITEATATYGDAVGNLAYTVRTTTFGLGRRGHTGTVLAGSRRLDGVARLVERSGGSYPRVTLVWPDGHGVEVTGSASLNDTAVLEPIAGSIESVPADGLRTEQAVGSGNLAALPDLASVEVEAGRIQLKGATTPVAQCLTLPGRTTACGVVSEGSTGAYALGVHVDGRRYALAATATPGAEYRFTLGGDGAWTAPVQSGEDRGWRLMVTAPPAAPEGGAVFLSTSSPETGRRGWHIAWAMH